MNSDARRRPAQAPPWWVVLVVLMIACRPDPRPEEIVQIRVGLVGSLTSLDPHRHFDTVSQSVLYNILEALTEFDSEGGIGPGLAESWENLDGLTWRFHLREGVYFHDGRLLTSADVAFSLERARHLPDSRLTSRLAMVESIDAVDATTVEIRTSVASPTLSNQLAFVLVVPEGSQDEIGSPVGTGPFMLGRSGSETDILLLRFEDYWREPALAAMARIELFEDPEDATRSLLAGEIDLVRLRRADVDRVQRDPRLEVLSRDMPGMHYVAFRVDRPPFSDSKVRRAVNLAVDRDRVIREILGGHALAAGEMVGPSVFGFVPNLNRVQRDLETAGRLLLEAGFENGFEVEIETWSGAEIAWLVEDLAEIGIVVTPVFREWKEYLAHRQEATLTYGANILQTGDAGDFLLSSAHTPDEELGYGQLNYIGYSNPELDELIEEAGRTLEVVRRKRIYADCLRILQIDLPYVPLFVPSAHYGIALDLQWEPRLDNVLRLYRAGRTAPSEPE